MSTYLAPSPGRSASKKAAASASPERPTSSYSINSIRAVPPSPSDDDSFTEDLKNNAVAHSTPKHNDIDDETGEQSGYLHPSAPNPALNPYRTRKPLNMSIASSIDSFSAIEAMLKPSVPNLRANASPIAEEDLAAMPAGPSIPLRHLQQRKAQNSRSGGESRDPRPIFIAAEMALGHMSRTKLADYADARPETPTPVSEAQRRHMHRDLGGRWSVAEVDMQTVLQAAPGDVGISGAGEGVVGAGGVASERQFEEMASAMVGRWPGDGG